jgi:hypothetical protein
MKMMAAAGAAALAGLWGIADIFGMAAPLAYATGDVNVGALSEQQGHGSCRWHLGPMCGRLQARSRLHVVTGHGRAWTRPGQRVCRLSCTGLSAELPATGLHRW